MDNKQKHQKRFLAFALSVAMTVVFIPSGLMAYADAGEGQPDETAEAAFANKNNSLKSENSVTGSVDLSASKQMLSGTITADDDFTFELVDEEGKTLQSKNCDKVSDADNSVTNSTITFDTINYTLDDLEYPEGAIESTVQAELDILQRMYEEAKADYEAQHAGDADPKPFMSIDEYSYQATGMSLSEYTEHLTELAEQTTLKEKTFIYYVHEVKGDDPDVTYDSNRYYYKVQAHDNGKGKIETVTTLWKIEKEDDTQVEDITFVNSRTTQVKVHKRWTDSGNQDGYRPDKDTFAGMIHLMNGETEVTDVTPQITEDSDGNLTILYADLPAVDEEGNEIKYTVKEDSVEHYFALNDEDTAEDGDTITNVHTPEKTRLTVVKKWDDFGNKLGTRDTAGAVFQLYKTVGDKTETAGVPIPVGTDDEWSYTWEQLPVKEDGQGITYSVKEILPDGSWYAVTISDPVTATDGGDETVTVTNKYDERTKTTVKKVWDDDNDKAGKRPSSLTVGLYQTVTESAPQPTPAANDQPAPGSGDQPAPDSGDQPTPDPEPKSVKRVSDQPAQAAQPADDQGTQGSDDQGTGDQTTPATGDQPAPASGDQPVQAAEPQPVKDASGNAVTVTLTAANNWESTIEDLPRYDANGNEITYSWKESETELSGRYTLSGTATEGTVTTLTNRYTPVPPSNCKILISKVDEDGEEIAGAVFEVYKTDGGTAKKLTASDYKWLSSNNRFTVGSEPYTLSGLADGTYEIREVKAPSGYKIGSKKPVTFTITGGVLDPAKNKIAANVEYEMTGNDGTYMFTITNNSDEETDEVKTGDTSHFTLYLGILAAAAFLLIAAVIRRRRREE